MPTVTRMLALAGLPVALVALTACGSRSVPGTAAPDGTPTSSSVATTSARPTSTTASRTSRPQTSTTTTRPASTAGTVGPTGYAGLRLGTAAAEVKAAGFIRVDVTGDGCTSYDLYVNGAVDGSVFISPDKGVEAIAPAHAVRTAEGLKIGDPLTTAVQVYPSIDPAEVNEIGRQLVSVPGNDKADYRVGFEQKVVSTLAIQLADQDCYE